MSKKAVAYYRVSTDKQGVRGLGMNAQIESVNKYIEFETLELIGEFQEVESGKKNDRPELAKAINFCIEHNATLLIAKLDRLARNVVFIGQLLEDDRINFVALDMPTASKFEFHIRAALAEEEARLISERTKAALAKSTKPLGAKNETIRLAALKTRQQNAKAFIEGYRPLVEFLRSQNDVISYQLVAEQLNKQGRLTRFNKPWSYVTVKRLFESLGHKNP